MGRADQRVSGQDPAPLPLLAQAALGFEPPMVAILSCEQMSGGGQLIARVSAHHTQYRVSQNHL